MALLQSLRELVDRDHASGVDALGIRGLDLRVRQLERTAEPRGLARKPDELPGPEPLLDELLAEPRRLHAGRSHVRRVEQLDLGHHLAARGPALADRADDRLGGLLALGDEMADRSDVREVEVARRQMPEELADGPDPQALQELGHLPA